MPVADKFMADGVGNGFPFCPSKRDVSGFDYWTTLGGYNKDHAASRLPTDEEIGLSLSNAMKMFWNFNGHTATHEYSYGSTRISTIDIDTDQVNSPPSAGPPIDRSCLSFLSEGAGSAPLGNTRASAFINRMYDGPASVESNFIGYGGVSVFAATGFGFFSWRDHPDPAFYNSVLEYSSSYGNLPLVARAESRRNDLTSVISINGLVSTRISPTRDDTTTFSDINFYTYPA